MGNTCSKSLESRMYNSAVKSRDVRVKKAKPTVITDIPPNITANIISRLTVKRIYNCACVCKYWYDVIKSPDCTPDVCTMIRSAEHIVSRALYMFEPEDEDEYDSRSCDCLLGYTAAVDRHTHLCYDGKFNLPINWNENICDNKESTTAVIGPSDGGKGKGFGNMECSTFKYSVNNSCNGLLLLCDEGLNKPLAICNPLVGEFLRLPGISKLVGNSEFCCGLGYDPNSNKYKVVSYISGNNKAEILTVGLGSWKTVETASYTPTAGQNSPTYFCGALHWLQDVAGSKDIIVFRVGDEKFVVFPLPECMIWGIITDTSMGVIRDNLYVCNVISNHKLELWVMKKYNVTKSWVKELSVQNENFCRWMHDSFQLVKYMRNGTVLMFHTPTCFINYNLSTGDFKCLRIREDYLIDAPRYEGILLVPNFAPLKDSFKGCNVEVLKVKSRWDKLKLAEERVVPCLVEDESPPFDEVDLEGLLPLIDEMLGDDTDDDEMLGPENFGDIEGMMGIED